MFFLISFDLFFPLVLTILSTVVFFSNFISLSACTFFLPFYFPLFLLFLYLYFISHPDFIFLFGFLRGIPIISLTSFASVKIRSFSFRDIARWDIYFQQFINLFGFYLDFVCSESFGMVMQPSFRSGFFLLTLHCFFFTLSLMLQSWVPFSLFFSFSLCRGFFWSIFFFNLPAIVQSSAAVEYTDCFSAEG